MRGGSPVPGEGSRALWGSEGPCAAGAGGHGVRLACAESALPSTTRRARPRRRPALRPAALARGGPISASGARGARSDAMRDAQAGVPSAGWPRAQLAFKDSMVRGILQFTPSIAFRYVLHRCESRDIRCRESYSFECRARRRPAARAGAEPCSDGRSLARAAPGCILRPPGRGRARRPRPEGRRAGGTGVPARSGGVRSEFAGLPVVPSLDNDPSAGSPTETLLRLLLPLNDKVQGTSRDVAGGGPPASPRSEHFTGPFNR